jgi:hypothetical protein
MTSLTAAAHPVAAAQTLPNGQIIPGQVGAILPPTQKITGSLIDAGAAKTLASTKTLVDAHKALGAGQKGGRRRKKHRGGAAAQNMNVPRSILPSGNSIPGVDATTNHKNAIDLHNQLIADSSGDGLLKSQPMQVGGRKKTKRKVKKRHGLRSYRTYRRKRNIGHATRRRRSRHMARTS